MAILAGVQRDTCPWNSGPFWNAQVAYGVRGSLVRGAENEVCIGCWTTLQTAVH